MNTDEIKEYNKIVIEVAEQMSKPWKWATFILAGLLAGFIAFHFLCPVEIDLDQSNNNSPEAINING